MESDYDIRDCRIRVEYTSSSPDAYLMLHIHRCVPEELDALTDVLPGISVFRCVSDTNVAYQCFVSERKSMLSSPNAHEALTMLSLPNPVKPTRELIEQAAVKFLELGVGLWGLFINSRFFVESLIRATASSSSRGFSRCRHLTRRRERLLRRYTRKRWSLDR